jgi:hypothetical protein
LAAKEKQRPFIASSRRRIGVHQASQPNASPSAIGTSRISVVAPLLAPTRVLRTQQRSIVRQPFEDMKWVLEVVET